MLQQYNKKELEELAGIYGFKGAYKLKKSELIEALTEFIPLNMESVLVMLELDELQKLEELIVRDKPVHNTELDLAYYNLLDLGLIELIEMKKDSKLIILPPIKVGYKKLDHAVIKAQAKENSRVRTHIMGLLNLYGVVEISWVCELYQRYHKVQLNENEIIYFMSKDRALSSRSQSIGNYIAHETIYTAAKDNFYHFIQLTKDKDYYVPECSYIKLMSDEFYYDNTLQVQKIKSYLKKNFSQDEEVIEEAVLTAVMFAKIDCDDSSNIISLILEEWRDIGIVPRDLVQANAVLMHIVNVMNTTRKWINKGYTSIELSLENTVGAPVGTPIGAQKSKVRKLDVGRNELCPCGSGEKYKECCGKPK